MTTTVDLQEVKSKIMEKLKASGWGVKLRGYIMSTDFDQILETLWKEKQEGKRFTPPLKEAFSAFENCLYDDLKIVIVGQDPYPTLGVADGMAFSCSNTLKPQPSLKNIFDALNQTVENIPERNPDLTRWAEQGVLLLNTALTCQVDKVGSHTDIWQGFTAYVLDMLNLTNTGLIFILLGKQAQEYESMIGSSHYVLKASHPASAAYSKTIWDCKDVFNEANNILNANNGFKIDW